MVLNWFRKLYDNNNIQKLHFINLDSAEHRSNCFHVTQATALSQLRDKCGIHKIHRTAIVVFFLYTVLLFILWLFVFPYKYILFMLFIFFFVILLMSLLYFFPIEKISNESNQENYHFNKFQFSKYPCSTCKEPATHRGHTSGLPRYKHLPSLWRVCVCMCLCVGYKNTLPDKLRTWQKKKKRWVWSPDLTQHQPETLMFLLITAF